jgi:hypothetical protein
MRLSKMAYPQQLKDAVYLLLRRVPSFANARARDSSFISYSRDDCPYLIFGDFGLFLLRQLGDKSTNSANQDWLRPSVELIDEMLTSENPEIENLIQVGVLEVLGDQPDAISLVKQYLSAAGKEKIEDWITVSQQL